MGAGVTVAYVNLSPNATYTATVSVAPSGVPRDEYILTAVAGDLSASAIQLNGVKLTYTSGGHMSPIVPRHVTDPTTPLLLPPHSYGFVVYPEAANPCTFASP